MKIEEFDGVLVDTVMDPHPGSRLEEAGELITKLVRDRLKNNSSVYNQAVARATIAVSNTGKTKTIVTDYAGKKVKLERVVGETMELEAYGIAETAIACGMSDSKILKRIVTHCTIVLATLLNEMRRNTVGHQRYILLFLDEPTVILTRKDAKIVAKPFVTAGFYDEG